MFSTTEWVFGLAILGGLVAAWRIYQHLRKLRHARNDSWDAQLIDQLRKRGSDPFKPHDVDFFLAFPTQEGAEQIAARLRLEFFHADVTHTPDNGTLQYSLHLHKSMQLTVPDMQDLGRRLTVAATEKGGRYDGWSAKEVPRTDQPA